MKRISSPNLIATLAALTPLLLAHVPASAQQAEARIVSHHMIWDAAPHNAFTGLTRFKGKWYCAFREGQGHVSHDGRIRIIVSDDGEQWASAALLEAPGELPDLRDGKIAVTPAGRLMVTAAAADRRTKPSRHQTYAWFSDDGAAWSEATAIGEPNFWLWRVTWHDGKAWSVGYQTGGERFIRLYRSDDGRSFDTHVARLHDQGYPNETGVLFLDDGTCLCLLRRDGSPNSGLLGRAKPPYRDWTWDDLGVRIGGPDMIRLPDGRFVAAVRLYDGGARTSLMWLDPSPAPGKAKLTEMLRLPSGGDTSYAGLAHHGGLLWVSYYSSHEGKTKVYLAKVKLPGA
jgi:hypothetical protein